MTSARLLWTAARCPVRSDWTPMPGPCWWCGLPSPTGTGWAVSAMPDTFADTTRGARVGTHVCAPCAWTMQGPWHLPPAQAQERLLARVDPAWRGNRRALVSVDGAPPEKRLLLRLEDGRIGLWMPGRNKAAEAAWEAAIPDLRRTPADVDGVLFVDAVAIDRLAPGPERVPFLFHHFAAREPDGSWLWVCATDADKAWMRDHLVRTDLGPGCAVLSVEKKHAVIHAEPYAEGSDRAVFFRGRSLRYAPPELARVFYAVHALADAGVSDREIASGEYMGRGLAVRTLRLDHEDLLRRHRGALLDVAIHLRRPRQEHDHDTLPRGA